MRFLLLFTAVFAFIACSKPKEKRLLVIENEINKQAMGADIGYKPGRLDTVVVANTKASIEQLEKLMEREIDSNWDEVINTYQKVYEDAQKEGDVDVYHVWKWEVDRMKRLKQMQPDDIDFSVYKYSYTINNLLVQNGPRTTVTNYYFFDHLDSLKGHIPEEKMKIIIRDNIKSDFQPYEFAFIHLETGVEI